MKMVVLANEQLYQELIQNITDVDWVKITEWPSAKKIPADAYFNLSENAAMENYADFDKPVFIHAVATTLNEIKNPENVCRILAWPGFLKRTLWEIAGHLSGQHVEVLNKINKPYIKVADEVGLVSAKVISMIINEAYFALEDEVSTKGEIDTAMKLGTNYPFGPFEWGNRIGLTPIYNLLKKLSIADKRYTPAALLQTEAAILLCP